MVWNKLGEKLPYVAFGRWLIVVCLWFSPVLAQDDKRAEEPPGQSQAETEQKPAQSQAAPAVSAEMPQLQPDPKSYRNPCEDPKEGQKSDLCQQWRMAEAAEETADWTLGQILATVAEAILLAIAIGIASWAGYWAKRAAVAGDETVEITRKIGMAQTRAYVTTEESTWMKTNDAWCFTHHWKNTGTTLALKTLTHVNWAVFGREIPDDFDYPDTGRDRGNDPAVIGPDQRLLSWPIFIPSDVVEDPHRNIYIWGWAEYDDIFTDTARHRTEFCYQVTIDSGAIDEGKVGIGLRIYGRFNGADDDCYRQPEPV